MIMIDTKIFPFQRMYLQNSYFHVLKKLDSSWGHDSTYSGSSSTFSLGSSRSISRKRRTSKSSRSSTSSQPDRHCYCSSAESGRFSEEVINSGYYGDDEVERCKCAKCVRAAAERAKNKPNIGEYDIISVDLSSVDNTPPRNTSSNRSHIKPYPYVKLNFDDYIIIPSSREEFCSGNIIHSTPVKDPLDLNGSVANVINTHPVHTIFEGQVAQAEIPCKLLDEEQSSVRALVPKMYRTSGCETSCCWWRENIAWQLRQRNKTQAENFVQLETAETRSRTRSKLRINRELADYLNRHAEFRPHAEITSSPAQIAIETDPLNRSEIVRAIRNHSGVAERVRKNSVAQLATAFLRQQDSPSEVRSNDDSDCSTCGWRPLASCRAVKTANDRERGVFAPRWRESVVNQLEMRNFLECKYFTDAIVRRTMSQLGVSTSQTDSTEATKDLDEYDIISDNEMSVSQNSGSTLKNSSDSLSKRHYSSPFSKLFKSKRASKSR